MRETTQEPPLRRTLAAVWLVGSSLIAMPAFLLTVGSDQVGDRLTGSVLVVLAMIGVLAALISLNTPARTRFRATLGAALVWLISGVVVFGSQEVLVDALWVGGVPTATAITAGLLVLAEGRSRR
jgi:hypothetical protein